jgi:hypothetical protein|nr:MAG TPA: hypothetical protein [Caudoviricetes sp.]
MKKVLEALDNESTVVHLDEYIHDTVEIENIVRDTYDGTINALDVTLVDNALTVKVLSDTEMGEEVSDAVLSYLEDKASFDYECEFNTSSVRVGGEQFIQSTINITATDSTVEKRKVVESVVNESISVSDIMDSDAFALSFSILKEIKSSSKPFFNMNTFNSVVADQVAKYICGLKDFADVLDEYKVELSDGGCSVSIKPNVSFDFKDKSYQYQATIELTVGDSSIIKEFIGSLKSNVKDFTKIQTKGNTIYIATKFF